MDVLREKHKCIVMRTDEVSSPYSESFKNGVYQLGVPQGQGDSSAHRRMDGRMSLKNFISAAMKQATPHTCFFFLVFFR